MNFFNNNQNQNNTDTKFYDILDITKDASDKDIKKAYKKKALKYHPDRNLENKKEAEIKFKEISKAYQILSDSKKRNLYDTYGENAVDDNANSGTSPFDVFETMFKGNSFGGMGMGMPFDMFGGGVNRHGSNNRGPDKKEVFKITLKDMMLGAEKIFKYDRQIIIENIDNDNDILCTECNGKGKVVKIVRSGPGMISQSITKCLKCNGFGKDVEFKLINEEIKLVIPKGSKKGDILKFEGLADEVPNVNCQGDLIIIFDIIETNVLQRHKNDLVYLKSILLSEALCGLEFIFNHPNGDNILIKNNNIIKPDEVKVIKGLGFPSKNLYKVGDLIIKFTIIFPEQIDDKVQKLIYKLLPKRESILDSLKNEINDYYLEEYEPESNFYDSDDEQEQPDMHPGQQCAQQ